MVRQGSSTTRPGGHDDATTGNHQTAPLPVMTQATPRTVSCPNCARPVAWIPENRYRPFCCERCKLIDLGQWATEQYRVPVEDLTPDAEPNEPDRQ